MLSTLTLSLILCLCSFVIGGLVLVAALVPVIDCPDESHSREQLQPCPHCNGRGKSPPLQHWYYLRYQAQQAEKFEEGVICGTGIPGQPSFWERTWWRVVDLFDNP